MTALGVGLGIRQNRKQATRERVLAAARELFGELGYEATTMRMVAKRAGVSVGGVFTTFSGKAELLFGVMAERLGDLYGELEQIAPYLHGSTLDRLRSIMAVHYGFETRRLSLFLAYIASSYSRSPGEAGLPPLGSNPSLNAMLKETLLAGVERGEVRPNADLDAFRDALVGCYFWNYRLTFQAGVEVDDLIALMDRQIGLLFAGVAAA